MDTNIILQDLQVRRNHHHYCTAQTHENIRIEKQASDIFSSVYRTGNSCDSHHLYESNWTLNSSVFARKNMKQELMNGTAWISPRLPSLGVDTERDIFPVVSSFHQIYKADKRCFVHSLYPSYLFVCFVFFCIL
jgi:hypothetical protein